MFFGDEGTQKNGTNRYSAPPGRQKWQQKGRTVDGMAMLHAICSMPHATWLFVSDAVPRPRPCIYAFRLCFQFIFCSRFRFSSPVPSPVPLFRATHHAPSTLISCRPHEPALRFSASFFVFRFSFVLCTARMTPPIFVSPCCVSRLALRVPHPVLRTLYPVPCISLPVTHTTLRFASRLGFSLSCFVSRTPCSAPLNGYNSPWCADCAGALYFRPPEHGRPNTGTTGTAVRS